MKRFVALFQTGWFLESLWTQVFIIQLLRTRKIPFIQSKPGLPVVVVTIAGIFLLSLLPSTFFGKMIGLTVMPFGYYLYLIITVVVYLLTVSYAKTIYVKKHKKLI